MGPPVGRPVVGTGSGTRFDEFSGGRRGRCYWLGIVETEEGEPSSKWEGKKDLLAAEDADDDGSGDGEAPAG